MQESTTPYIKIEQSRDGGFGDLRRDVEMDTLPRASEHDALQPNQDVDSAWDSIFTLVSLRAFRFNDKSLSIFTVHTNLHFRRLHH